MSYNIDTWKTKRLVDLKLPLSLLEGSCDDSEYDRALDKYEFQFREGGRVAGTCCDDMLAVEEIELWGEGSGTAFHGIFVEMFEQSTGELEAVLVWEGGDSISRVIVKDGEFTTSEVEL